MNFISKKVKRTLADWPSPVITSLCATQWLILKGSPRGAKNLGILNYLPSQTSVYFGHFMSNYIVRRFS